MQLEKHTAKVHEKKKSVQSYFCDNCQMEFLLYKELKSHNIIAHTGPQPHICCVCNATFSQNVSLKLHIAIVHDGKKPSECSLTYAKKSVEEKYEGNNRKIDSISMDELDVGCDVKTVLHSNIEIESIDPLAI